MTTSITKTDAITMTGAIQQFLLSLLDIAENAVSSLPWVLAGNYPVAHKEGGGMPLTRVTKAEAKSTLVRYITNAIEGGFSPCSHFPTKPSLAGMRRVLEETYTIKSGKNAGTNVATLAYALNRIGAAERRAIRSANSAAALDKAQKAGGVWFALDVVFSSGDREGESRPYPTEMKARKAWAREHVDPNWSYVDHDNTGEQLGKPEKAIVLDKAHVSQGTFVVVDENTTVQADDVTMTQDEAIITAAQGLGSKATTVAGARKFLANLS